MGNPFSVLGRLWQELAQMHQRDLSLIHLLIKSVCPSMALEVLCDSVWVDMTREASCGHSYVRGGRA